MDKSKKNQIQILIEGRKTIETHHQQSANFEKDIFKRALDMMSSKAKQDEMDSGERESIMDAFRSDL